MNCTTLKHKISNQPQEAWLPQPPSTPSELTALGLEAANGDSVAYQELVNHPDYLAGLTKTSRWLCRHSSISADELLSEFFLRLPSKIRKYGNKNGASILSWSCGVLRHLHIDLLRSEWRDSDRVEYSDEPVGETERSIDTADSRVALIETFRTLNAREKKLLLLRASEENLDAIVAKIENVSDPREIQNRRPKISRELKAVEQKLLQSLSIIDTGRLQGSKGPLKIKY